jgi:hypothetical protein
MAHRYHRSHRYCLASEEGCKCPAEIKEIKERTSQARRVSNVPQSRWSSENRIMSYMNYAESLWRRERSVDLLLSCVPLVASVTLRDAERFDTKKEANTCPFLGARKERKEHPP